MWEGVGVMWEGVGDGCRSRNVCERSGCITSMFQEQECVAQYLSCLVTHPPPTFSTFTMRVIIDAQMCFKRIPYMYV